MHSQHQSPCRLNKTTINPTTTIVHAAATPIEIVCARALASGFVLTHPVDDVAVPVVVVELAVVPVVVVLVVVVVVVSSTTVTIISSDTWFPPSSKTTSWQLLTPIWCEDSEGTQEFAGH
ncbi:MAG: hypothetical protein ACTSUH_10135 [Candidatus Thorarchaeota archaeon]